MSIFGSVWRNPVRRNKLVLEDGSRVAVLGGGPAGSLFSYFLLLFAERTQRTVEVDIYEPRNFSAIGPAGCNMCGGILSESLVQMLATEGIILPDSVVQRSLDAYVLHTEAGQCHIEVPSREKRIGAVHRGGGPRGKYVPNWYSFDGHLLNLALGRGANRISKRVTDVAWNGGRPEIRIPGEPARVYDLIAGAVGLNSPELRLFEQLGFGYRRPDTAKTYVTELPFGVESITEWFGGAVHIFLLKIPELEFAALIPKGDYVTVCMLGKHIDRRIVSQFFEHPAVRQCFPPNWQLPSDACHCSPHMFLREAIHPFADRVVLIGDSGTSRLFKDGVGGAYRTAKAAAQTAIFEGISAGDFNRRYVRECRRIQRDNRFGNLIFALAYVARRWKGLTYALLEAAKYEQTAREGSRRLSLVLWDTFTGSAPYRNIFYRCFHPTMLRNILLGAGHALSLYFKGPAKPSNSARADTAVNEDAGSGKLGKVYQNGEIIVREGEEGEHMYVVQDGRVKVTREHDGREIVLAELVVSDVFGEMALFNKEKRSATVRAVGQARVLRVDRTGFLRRVHEDPSLAFRLLQQMSYRIGELDAELTRLKSDAFKHAS